MRKAGKVQVVLQNEASECALAALAMVASAYGDRRPLAAFRRPEDGGRGLSLTQLVDRAASLGLGCRGLRIELADLAQLSMPAILHWELRHFVVLERCDQRGIHIVDPASGRRHVAWGEVSRAFTGVALELWPEQGFAPVRSRPVIQWRRLIGQCDGVWSALARIVALALLMECCALLLPLFVQTVVDQVLASGDLALLHVLAVAFIVLVTAREVMAWLRGWMARILTSRLGLFWQSRLSSHLFRLPIPFFERRSLGEILSRYGSVESIQRTVAGSLVEALLDGMMVLLVLGLMAWYSPALVAVVLVGVALYATLTIVTFVRVADGMNQELGAAARLRSHTVESIRGIQTLRLAGAESLRLGHWRNLLVEQLNMQLDVERLRLLSRTGSRWISGVERIVVIWIAASMVLDRSFSVGMLIAFLAYRDQFSARVLSLIDRIVELRLLRVHAERLADITDAEPERGSGAEQRAVTRIDSVELSGIRFRYGGDEPLVLDGLGFQLRQGETVAITGPSGCGKTTILKLITGLMQPEAGQILINGEPLARVDLQGFRALCATVMQDDHLFAGTIADNIALFDAAPDPERIRHCARAAAVHEEIERFPMGYHTLVGDMGTALSGGQKQRVLLARALYRQPQLLLLDEATSDLDVVSERAVNEAVRALSITRLIVAHRPQTIAMADRVLVMGAGGIVESYRPAARVRSSWVGAEEEPA